MEKVFEDYFSELQADMLSICLEYVEKRAEVIYIYCSFESNMVSSGFFYKVNGKIVKKHKLNDAIGSDEKKYDVSIARQEGAITVINDDIEALKNLCEKYHREMPTQIKLIYDIKNSKLNADCGYDLFYSNHRTKTADNILEEWFQLEKKKEE